VASLGGDRWEVNKTVLIIVAGAFFASAAALFAGNDRPAANVPSTVPILVELFTSEGCSSCPPADAFLQKLDTQPLPGAQLIVLSEHVDYWNHIGWADPYSSHAYSLRQDAYGDHFHLASVYTPQMVVDGTDEFGGSSSQDAQKALEKAVATKKLDVRISAVTLEGNVLRAHIETGRLLSRPKKADVWLAVALSHAESQVAGGENAGRRLTHVAVVRALSRAGRVESGQAFSQDVSVKLDKEVDTASLRVIAFVQEPGPGRVLGAATEKVAK
jgi:hypothetical protein